MAEAYDAGQPHEFGHIGCGFTMAGVPRVTIMVAMVGFMGTIDMLIVMQLH